MSLVAMVWALKHAPVTDPVEHLVLIGLADHARDDGRGSRPSVATLATYARCSPRSVHNKLRRLEESGLIVRGDQRETAHLQGNRRPVVWDLSVGMHEVQRSTDGPAGVHDGGVRGAQAGDSAVHAVADRTVPDPSLEPSENLPSTAARSTTLEGAFDAFWQVYPRRVGKQAARRSWERAVKAAGSVEAILEGAERYRDDPNRAPAYTAHPSSWLNAGRWDDEPIPARGGGSHADRQADLLRREREWARQHDEQEQGEHLQLEGPEEEL